MLGAKSAVNQNQIGHIDEVIGLLTGKVSQRDEFIHESWRRCVSQHGLDPIATRSALHRSRGTVERTSGRDGRTPAHGAFRLRGPLSADLAPRLCAAVDRRRRHHGRFHGRSDRPRPSVAGPGSILAPIGTRRLAGTCAVGTCIATGQALTVHQSDHFDAAQYIADMQRPSPIFHSNGDLAAVLDISALHSAEPKISQYLALQFARSSPTI